MSTKAILGGPHTSCANYSPVPIWLLRMQGHACTAFSLHECTSMRNSMYMHVDHQPPPSNRQSLHYLTDNHYTTAMATYSVVQEREIEGMLC